MLLCRVDDEIELRLLESEHVAALEGLACGDLAFAQGEWVFPKGKADRWLADVLRETGEGSRLDAGIFRGTTLLGLIALHNIDRLHRSADVDYALDSRHRNRGIMTDACRALVSYAHVVIGITHIRICCDADNLPALKVPEKLGFTRERVLRSHYQSHTGARDVVVYSLHWSKPE